MTSKAEELATLQFQIDRFTESMENFFEIYEEYFTAGLFHDGEYSLRRLTDSYNRLQESMRSLNYEVKYLVHCNDLFGYEKMNYLLELCQIIDDMSYNSTPESLHQTIEDLREKYQNKEHLSLG